MLTIFPSLLTLQLIAPFLLRITIGLIFTNFGKTKLGRQKKEKAAFFESIGLRPGLTFVWAIGLIEIITGLLFIVGFLTQIASVIAIIILLTALLLKKKHPESFESSCGYLILCLIVAISLMFTGPGFLAFDLPL
jgi:putative oxidoreductase